MDGGILSETTLIPVSFVITIIGVAVWIYSIRSKTHENSLRISEMEKDFVAMITKIETRMNQMEEAEKGKMERLVRMETKLDLLLSKHDKN